MPLQIFPQMFVCLTYKFLVYGTQAVWIGYACADCFMKILYPPVIKYRVLENGPLISDFPIKTSIHRRFSIAMFDDQKVPGIMNAAKIQT